MVLLFRTEVGLMRYRSLSLLLVFSSLVSAQELIEFENGRIADAEAINENFRRLKDAMGSASGCSARQVGADVVIDCVDGSTGTIGAGGNLISVDPYLGAAPVLLDCTDIGDFIEEAINLRLNDENFLGYVSAADFPTMNQDAEATLKDLLFSVLSLDVFNESYANRYLQRWATEQAIREVRRNAVKSCNGEGWFEQMESSDLVYEQENPGGYSRQLRVTVTGGGSISSFPAGLNCRDDCTASFVEGTDIVLRARADRGFSLANWSGACSGTDTACRVTLNGDQQVEASFSEIPWQSLGTFSVASLGFNESSELFTFTLPIDASELEVYMTGGTDGDADLYVTSEAFWNTYQVWQCVPRISGTSEENCLTDWLRPLQLGGVYWVGVYGNFPVTSISVSIRYR